MTHYEFAAGLNACLNMVLQLVGGDGLGELDRLQEEFAVKLEAVRAQTTDLEAQAGELEANQFSTTTKLRGIEFGHHSFDLLGMNANNFEDNPDLFFFNLQAQVSF